ncbi:hypothetical protein PUV47_01420 [Pseudovibrio exalbescens]|uniref:hypothetical protein n=1 Tax=Pseudovibrio exalbescens TaxID=197461 RepID=UPI00236594D9|nr:hypothetical protein [Pseudovibrio exalbescens]MDD7908561.1 hypothetical protein [Pseudovibrio exalbescens]
MSMKKEAFAVQKEAPIFGQWHKAGDTVEMSEAQARFLCLNGTLKATKPARKTGSSKTTAKPDEANKA